MKTTYKLLGAFWDGRDTLDVPPSEIQESTMVRDYKEDYDLFDTDEYVRSVNISELLRFDSKEKIQSTIKKLNYCSKVVVILDGKVQSSNPIVNRFLAKRISQCLRFVKDNVDGPALGIVTR